MFYKLIRYVRQYYWSYKNLKIFCPKLVRVKGAQIRKLYLAVPIVPIIPCGCKTGWWWWSFFFLILCYTWTWGMCSRCGAFYLSWSQTKNCWGGLFEEGGEGVGIWAVARVSDRLIFWLLSASDTFRKWKLVGVGHMFTRMWHFRAVDTKPLDPEKKKKRFFFGVYYFTREVCCTRCRDTVDREGKLGLW